MDDPDIYERSLETFTYTTLKKNLNRNQLSVRYREEIVVANVFNDMVNQQRILCDYSIDYKFVCERCSGKSIQNHLLILLSPIISRVESNPASQAGPIITSSFPSNTAKWNFNNVFR